MNRFIKTASFALALATLGPALRAAPEEPIKRYQANAVSMLEFAIQESKDPKFPLTLKALGYEEGSAVFAIYINQYGGLEDYLLLEASHVDFAKAVEKVLPDWSYSVPLVDGEVASIVSRIKVKFERGKGVIYESTGYSNILGHINSHFADDEAYRIFALDELDSIPIPTHMEKPSFHVDLLEERDIVNAVFEFFIDTEGNVRIPTLREADDKVDERLLVIAQNALLQWKFQPPMHKGKPVVAKAAQPFRFAKSKDW